MTLIEASKISSVHSVQIRNGNSGIPLIIFDGCDYRIFQEGLKEKEMTKYSVTLGDVLSEDWQFRVDKWLGETEKEDKDVRRKNVRSR